MKVKHGWRWVNCYCGRCSKPHRHPIHHSTHYRASAKKDLATGGYKPLIDCYECVTAKASPTMVKMYAAIYERICKEADSNDPNQKAAAKK